MGMGRTGRTQKVNFLLMLASLLLVCTRNLLYMSYGGLLVLDGIATH